MGTPKEFEKEKLIIGILTSQPQRDTYLNELLEKAFGPVDFISLKQEFTFTSYYHQEMGNPLIRYFVSFAKLVDPALLAEIKIKTNELELALSEEGKRRFNLDPGLMALSRFILASTKNSSHRVPLKDGIYAEIELVFENRSFRPVAWTYPDYRTEFYISVLNTIRELYKKNLQAKR